MSRFGAELMVPGIQATRETVEAQLWFGKWEQQKFQGGVIASTTTDTGHTSQTSQLRPGLLLGQITSSEKLVHWNPWATDGSQVISGILGIHLDLTQDGVASDRYSGHLFYGGNVKASEILVPGQTSAGIAGQDYEFIIREQLKHRFVFDDDIYGEYTAPKTYNVTGSTSAVTVTTAMHNTTFTNAGSTAACTFTLPAPVPGLKFKFSQSVASTADMVLDGPSIGEFIFSATSAANTYTLSAGAYEVITVEAVAVAVTSGVPSAWKYMVHGHSVDNAT